MFDFNEPKQGKWQKLAFEKTMLPSFNLTTNHGGNEMNLKRLIKLATPIISAAALMASMPATASDGEKVYKKACKMCHGAGMMGAPKMGDAAAWADRIAKGMDTLNDHAINGFGKMKPKGGKKSLSDDDVKAAVAYMVESSK